MPKSRGRRKPRRIRSHGGRTHSTRSGANLDLLPLLQATDQAEARGDAAAALEIIERDLHDRKDLRFWRPERLQRLLQLDVHGALLPRWATSRWILDQAAQQLDPGFRGRASQALDIAIGVRGVETLVGVDELDARCKVMDHDWVYRQVLLYELGALRRFLARGAAADLVVGADRIHEWARAPMGAYRLLEETPRTLRWLDLGTGTSRESTNLGAASLLEAGECAIGRLVPIDGGAMFETAPLFVPEQVALDVARDPSGWISSLRQSCRNPPPGTEGISTLRSHFPLLSDVPRAVQWSLTKATAVWLSEHEVIEGADRHARPEAALVRAAMDGWLAVQDLPCNPWPSVAAALLEPAVLRDLRAGLVPSDHPRLLALGEQLAEPAASLCRALAEELQDAA